MFYRLVAILGGAFGTALLVAFYLAYRAAARDKAKVEPPKEEPIAPVKELVPAEVQIVIMCKDIPPGAYQGSTILAGDVASLLLKGIRFRCSIVGETTERHEFNVPESASRDDYAILRVYFDDGEDLIGLKSQLRLRARLNSSMHDGREGRIVGLSRLDDLSSLTDFSV
jgi:hypothetical protein